MVKMIHLIVSISLAEGHMPVEIKVVKTEKELNEFIDFAWQIYKGNKFWIPNLKAEYRKMLTPGKYPFWEHAERELYIAFKDGKPAGRVAAIRDDNHDKEHNEKAGFFGFYECIDDIEVSKKLLETAARWLKAKNCVYMRGPASPSVNDEYGWLLEGFDMEPAVMMPYNPRYYLKQADAFGMKKVKDLYAFHKCSLTGIPERIEKMMKRIKRTSLFNIRTLDLKHFDRDVAIIKDVYNKAWENNWGAVPMTKAEMDLAAEGMKQFFDPKLIIIAETKDGNKPAGIAITLPNLNEVLKHVSGCDGIMGLGLLGLLKFMWYKPKIKGCRALIGGCLKEYRQTGLIAEIFYESAKNGIERYDWCELSWNLEDNRMVNEFDAELGSVLYKKYRLYQLPL